MNGELFIMFLGELLFFVGLFYANYATDNPPSIDKQLLTNDCAASRAGAPVNVAKSSALGADTCSSTQSKSFNLIVGLFLRYALSVLCYLVYRAA